MHSSQFRPYPAPMHRSLLALLALLLAAPAAADTMVSNVNGYTLTQAGAVQRFSAMLVGPDGRVKQLFAAGQRTPRRTQFRVNGQGRTLIPGIIDAHGHVMGLGAQALQLDLSETTSLADALSKISAYAAANPTPRWIVGRGWNQEKWGLGRFPTAAELDRAVANRPVYLERVDGHAGWANSLAMREAGITAATAAPSGGRIEKDGAQPSGIFVDAAAELVTRVIPAPLPRQRDEQLATAQRLLLSQGITATADMGTTVNDWTVFRRAGDYGRLRVRIMSYAAGVEPLLAVAGSGPTPWLYGSRLKMGGVKLYLDGALGSRGAYLKAPYADAPGQRGLQLLTDTELKNLASRASMDGFQVAAHAIGDAANANLLGAFEELANTYGGDRRWRVEHAQVVDPADLPRFGRRGIIASMQPVHQTSDRTMAEARLGPGRLGGAYAWNSMLRAGSRLAFGSDYPVESPNPFVALAAAATRTDPANQPAGGWQPQERVTFAQAFAAFTTGAAYAGFAEDRLGSLEPGRLADFVLLDRDPFTATPDNLRRTQVQETWVGGYKAWDRTNGVAGTTPAQASPSPRR